MAIFLPFLMVPGLTSLLFKELVITIAIVIGFSLVSSLTVVPTISSLLFKETNRQGIDNKGRFSLVIDRSMERITSIYSRLIMNIISSHKVKVLLIFIVLLIVAVFSFRFLGTEFLPKADDGMITVKVKMPTGTAVQETDKVLKQIENVVQNLPLIESYSTLSGGKVWGLVTYEIANEGEVDIQLVPKSKRKLSTDEFIAKYAKEIQKNVKYPGAKVKVFHTKMKGIRQTGEFDIEIEIHSPKTTSLVEMYETAAKMVSKIKDIGDISNLDISMDITKPEYQLLINRTKIADLGLSASQVAGTIKTLVDGQIATYYEEDGYYYPIRLVVNEKYFKGKEDVSNIPLFSKSGLIYLRDIGKLTYMVSPVSVNRLDQMRVIKVTASVLSGNVGKITSEVYKRVKNISLPPGSFLRTGGQAQMMRENFKNMVFVILLGIFFAFVLLAIQFESLFLPAIIILMIPFPLIGFIFVLLVFGIPLGVTALIGIIVLIGMLINHWVLVLSFIEEQIAGGVGIKESIVTGASLRLRPIFMTFLTDVLGLFPFILALGEGTEMLRPLGVAVVGGISFSLLVTFILLPVFYSVIKSYLLKGKDIK
jgi:multidrug efflux pump subunit AcrB